MPRFGLPEPPATDPATLVLPQLFEAHVARAPEARALVCDGERLSYAELNARANQVAHWLRALGVQGDDRVAIALPRSTHLVVAILGVLKAGAAYVPLDVAYPSARLALMLTDSAPKALIAHRSMAAELAIGGLPLLDPSEPQALVGQPTHNLDTAAIGLHPDHLAYVIYTSGSTGQPKGVMMAHRHIVRLLGSTEHWYGFGPGDVGTMFHSCAFDVSVLEMWSMLGCGGTLVMVPFDVSRSPREFYALVARERVTILCQTPSAFVPLIAAQAEAGDDASGHALRCIIFAGEALRFQTLKPWVARNPMVRTRLVNSYGPTETQYASYKELSPDDVANGIASNIGVPFPDLQFHVLREDGSVCDDGEVGELFIGGAGVARGYLLRPELTAERFLPDRFSQRPGARIYKTGDLVRRLAGNELEYIGRNDTQVKFSGFRVELGEIESALTALPIVRDACVIVREDEPGDQRLVAYYVSADGNPKPTAALREPLAARLAIHMIPGTFVHLAQMPLTPNGKADRRALPKPSAQRPDISAHHRQPSTSAEALVASAFGEVLGLEGIGADDNFFELGGTSLLAMKALALIATRSGVRLSVPSIISAPTPAGLAARLAPQQAPVKRARRTAEAGAAAVEAAHAPIAIIGMAGRFPGAADLDAFWRLMAEGRDGIRHFSDDDLAAAGVCEALRSDPAYVKARGIVEDGEAFDAALFGMSRRDAEVTDPQQRALLEAAWACLEHAGYAPDRTAEDAGSVGVFAGVHSLTYWQRALMASPEAMARFGEFVAMLGNDKDYVATRIAHRLDLRGPAVSVHTACSTSLVAIVQAMDALRLSRCDMALAGGASLITPATSGYLYEEGAMLSPDAQTRSFDAAAQGTSFNDGVAMVLMKRLADAQRDGDVIHAVLLGGACNNDGAHKASFTAPSVQGQAEVIAAALEDARVDAGSMAYVEAHGTATPMGDPVEVEGLTQAYVGVAPQSVWLGSVKSNVGHTTAAAGATGLIKTVLALTHELLPGVRHFKAPNPHIDFAATPFRVVAHNTPWPRGSTPRRAGVSSFGVGGTNAHVIVEEAPPLPPRAEDAPVSAANPVLLPLAAQTPQALARLASDLAEHLAAHPEQPLPDVAHTLAVGRSQRLPQRLAVAAPSREAAIAALKSPQAAGRVQAQVASAAPPQIWLFPGQGSQYVGMGAGLAAASPLFNALLDEALDAVQPHLPFHLRERMAQGPAEALQATEATQSATFCVEVALARWWLAQGHTPTLMIGHSVGEFAAAVIAGVMSLEAAAKAVAARGLAMAMQPPGRMLTVRAPAAEIAARLPESLSLAADNAPRACVVAGPADAIAAFAAQLEAGGIAVRALHTSHAFHSSMMAGAVAPLREVMASLALHAPERAVQSTLTGAALGAEAQDPDYWARHLREPVRFGPAVASALAAHPGAVWLEMGPRSALTQLVGQQREASGGVITALPLLGDAPDAEALAALKVAGLLWCLGAAPLPAAPGQRVVLPTYPFEREQMSLQAVAPRAAPQPGAASGAGASGAPSSPLRDLVAQQIHLMGAQLELLKRRRT